MYAGRFVETAPVLELYKHPKHPYTKALIKSIPAISGRGNRGLSVIQGRPPDLARLPPGCAFHPRCPDAIGVCRESAPPLEVIGEDRFAACFRAEK
jgi:oligopeptide/dipeptide ABC transporter ATP-binding protein